MARFCPLFSSSSGNAIYLGAGEHGILIDAGANSKQLHIALEQIGVNAGSIGAIFITHEHSDHIMGLRVFASKHNIPVYGSGGTLAALLDAGALNDKFPHEIMRDEVTIGDICVRRFPTSHDSRESCGYTVNLGGRKAGICTDTGVITDEITAALSDCDLVMLESNYDENRLEYGPYPPQLKSRIRSGIGHLSNDVCAETVAGLLNAGVRRFVLGHLSPVNNTPALAFACTHSMLTRIGAVQNKDYALTVAEKVNNSDKYIVF